MRQRTYGTQDRQRKKVHRQSLLEHLRCRAPQSPRYVCESIRLAVFTGNDSRQAPAKASESERAILSIILTLVKSWTKRLVSSTNKYASYSLAPTGAQTKVRHCQPRTNDDCLGYCCDGTYGIPTGRSFEYRSGGFLHHPAQLMPGQHQFTLR